MLTVVAILIILASLTGWDLAVNKTYWLTVWSAVWAGLKRICLASVSDWRAALDRFLLAVGIILLAASLWSPLPAATTPGGSYADLRAAVVAYQIAHHLTGDGVWGNKTNTSYVKGL